MFNTFDELNHTQISVNHMLRVSFVLVHVLHLVCRWSGKYGKL